MTNNVFATGNVQRVLAAIVSKIHAHVCIFNAHVCCVWNGSFQLTAPYTSSSPRGYSGCSVPVFAKLDCTNNVAQLMEYVYFLEFDEPRSQYLIMMGSSSRCVCTV